MEDKIKEVLDIQLKSGIFLEIKVFTKVPIKGQYSLNYRLDYGRT